MVLSMRPKLSNGIIHCAVCLNLGGAKVSADTIVKGYAVCANHVELVTQPNFDIFQLRGKKAKDERVYGKPV